MKNRCRAKVRAKAKGVSLWQTRLAMAAAKTGYRFCRAVAIYGVYLDQKIRSRIDGKVGNCPRQFMVEWSTLSQT